jgi:hypothetical protein
MSSGSTLTLQRELIRLLGHCVQQVVAHLLDEASPRIKGDLKLTRLGWDMDGVPAEDAAQRITRAAGWT